MVDILDGKIARDSYKKTLIERSKALPKRPTLALIQIGNNPESSIYIEQKKKFAYSIDARVEHIILRSDSSMEVVKNTIGSFNERKDIHGIIIQLPLPQHLDTLALINTVDPNKDVDGLTDTNQSLLAEGKPHFIPATAKGVLSLLGFYNVIISGRKAVVFGRSRLVGTPIAHLLRMMGADVSVCTSQTINPRTISKMADILVIAIGKPELIDATYIKPGAIVVDVGINSLPNTNTTDKNAKRKLVGDVNYLSVSPLVKAISPVPGGVGPMTVLSLFDNLILSAENMCRNID